MKSLYNLVKKYARDIAKKNEILRKIMRVCIEYYRRLRYWINTRGITVDNNTIVFNSFNGKSYSCTPKAIYNYMMSSGKYKDYKYIWVVRDKEKYSFLEKQVNTYIVIDKTKEYERALASAKYWVFNYRIYDHIFPKKNQVYIQCWHGTPLKRLGYDIENSQNAMNSIKEIQNKYCTDAMKFAYILSPSPFATEKFASAWNLNKTGQENKIVELGYPRDDYLYNYTKKDVAYIKELLKIPKDKKVILYAPTWRDNQHSSELGYVYKNSIDFGRLRESIADDWIILFRAHYLVANSFDFEQYNGFVFDVSSYDDINELYVVSDMLITDYSSVLFDYANLKRPILFYMYDLEYYENELRGFYIDLEELPGPIIKNENELIDKICSYNTWFNYDEKYRAFNDKFNCLNDGNASKRFVEKLIEP